MKLLKKFAVILLVMVYMQSCTSEDDNILADDTTRSISIVNTTVKSGQWVITNYNDSGKDETNHYNGYQFSFNEDGSLVATNGTNTYNGTWSVTKDDDSNDDNPSSDNDIDFNISFSSPADFAELSDDWDISSASDTKIELKDVSGGDGSIDLLTFQKL